jgi:hypothetical protein
LGHSCPPGSGSKTLIQRVTKLSQILETVKREKDRNSKNRNKKPERRDLIEKKFLNVRKNTGKNKSEFQEDKRKR